MTPPIDTYRVAAIQFEPLLGAKDQNIAQLQALVERAAQNGARLIVLPEMATTGYCWYSRDEVGPFVEPIPGPTTGFPSPLRASNPSATAAKPVPTNSRRFSIAIPRSGHTSPPRAYAITLSTQQRFAPIRDSPCANGLLFNNSVEFTADPSRIEPAQKFSFLGQSNPKQCAQELEALMPQSKCKYENGQCSFYSIYQPPIEDIQFLVSRLIKTIFSIYLTVLLQSYNKTNNNISY